MLKRIFTPAVFFAVFLFSVLALSASDTEADLPACQFEVSPVFGDNMIFQQNEPIRIWGTSMHEGGIITARLGSSVGSSAVKDGRWEISLAERGYSSDPIVLEIFGGEDTYISFENIRIGDIWYVMGQSNVEYTIAADPDADNFLSSLDGTENITLCTPGLDGVNSNSVRWRKMSRYSAYTSSALGCYIAKDLDDAFNSSIPVGIISLGFSGREISDFMPPDKSFSGGNGGKIYQNVLSHFLRMPVKGIVWYQGEADANNYSQYVSKFTKMINHLRSQKEMINPLPVYAVELPPCFSDPKDPARQYVDFGTVRAEIGSLTYLLEDFYMCPTSDLWHNKLYSNNIHPNNKKEIAKRLSLMLLSKEYGYGNENVFFPPTLSSAEVTKEGVALSFSFVNGKLNCPDLSGFLIIGKDWNIIENARLTLSDNMLTVSSDEDIYIIRYNSRTENVFGEDIFLSDSNLPSPAFCINLKTPPHKGVNKLTVIIVIIIVFLLLIPCGYLLKKLFFKGDKI